MNHKKPVSEPLPLTQEMRELRGEEPSDHAVDRAVFAMQSPPAPTKAKSHPWLLRAGSATLAATALVSMMFVASQRATASDLSDISKAVQARPVRYTKTFRPTKDGEIKQTGELWISGEKYLLKMVDGNGVSTVLHDGKLTYIHYPPAKPTIDDTKGDKFPVEDIDSYLRIPKGKVTGLSHVTIDGQNLDKYSLKFSAMSFDLYVEPETRLPIRRDVLGNGKLIERNTYEYPASFPKDQFSVPLAPIANDYRALRKQLAERLKGPGETKEVNGVKITLLAVIVGKYQVMALWTGGAPADYVKEGSMWVVGHSPKLAGPRPEPFSVPFQVPLNQDVKKPIFVGGKELHGDSAWFKGVDFKAPFKIDVVAWQSDRTKPNIAPDDTDLGYRSNPAGRLQFTVTDPIYADDPDRLLWKESYEGVKNAKSR